MKNEKVFDSSYFFNHFFYSVARNEKWKLKKLKVKSRTTGLGLKHSVCNNPSKIFGIFKSAPHISPGALCAASDPMAIQPDSGFPDEGISFVHKALACQPEPFPLWSFPDYSKDSLKWMQNLIKHEMGSLLVKRFKSELRKFGGKWKSRIPVWNNLFGKGTS